MADTALEIALVAADRTVWSGRGTMVIARTVEGDIGVLRGHAPMLSLLTDAVVEIVTEEGHTVVAAVDGGFVSVANDRVSILSERATLAEEIDLDQARADLDVASQHPVDTANGAERAIRQAEARIRAVERAR